MGPKRPPGGLQGACGRPWAAKVDFRSILGPLWAPLWGPKIVQKTCKKEAVFQHRSGTTFFGPCSRRGSLLGPGWAHLGPILGLFRGSNLDPWPQTAIFLEMLIFPKENHDFHGPGGSEKGPQNDPETGPKTGCHAKPPPRRSRGPPWCLLGSIWVRLGPRKGPQNGSKNDTDFEAIFDPPRGARAERTPNHPAPPLARRYVDIKI